MTNEDAMRFILESQSRMAEHLERLEANVEKVNEQQMKTEKVLGELTQATLNVIAVLVENAKAGDERAEWRLERLDERINSLIATVERYISHRNGNREERPE